MGAGGRTCGGMEAEAGAGKQRFGACLFGMVAFVLSVLPAQSHFLPCCEGAGKVFESVETAGFARLICCSAARGGLHKPNPKLPSPRHTQACLGG